MQVWRLPDLVQTLTLRGHRRGVWTVQFSPIDQCVLTGSGDATIRLWALTDGSCLKTFEGHSASVLRASFITFGTQVAYPHLLGNHNHRPICVQRPSAKVSPCIFGGKGASGAC